jgi:acetoacetyl-CoA reductase
VYHDRHGFTKALALEVAQWVTVNTISPGYIGTKMVMAIPKDVLEFSLRSAQPPGKAGGDRGPHHLPLCSDEAVFVTGANIAVNGGQHMQ